MGRGGSQATLEQRPTAREGAQTRKARLLARRSHHFMPELRGERLALTMTLT